VRKSERREEGRGGESGIRESEENP